MQGIVRRDEARNVDEDLARSRFAGKFVKRHIGSIRYPVTELELAEKYTRGALKNANPADGLNVHSGTIMQ